MICIQKDGHRPGWICRYFRGSRRAGKFKPGISRPGGKYRKLTTAAAAAAVISCSNLSHSWCAAGAWENNFPTFTVGVYPGIPVEASGLDRDPAVHPASECRKLYSPHVTWRFLWFCPISAPPAMARKFKYMPAWTSNSNFAIAFRHLTALGVRWGADTRNLPA